MRFWLLVLAGCGRLGFDAGGTAAPDAGTPSGEFAPGIGNCADAEVGPFVEIATFPTAGGGYGLWSAPPDLLVADTTGGLRDLRIDGGSFTQRGALPSLGWVEAVVSDGSYFYVGAPGTGFYVVTLAADGALAVAAQDTVQLTEARHAWVSGGLVYVPAGGAGLFAYHFDGAILSRVGVPAPTLSWAQGVWASGQRVLFADGDRFRVMDFDGALFTDAVAPDATHTGSSRVWSDGTRTFVANGDGVTAWEIQGGALHELDTYSMTAAARDVWSDGVHVFAGDDSGTLVALAFDGAHLTRLDSVDTGDATLGVFGDGTYIYANDLTGGVHAYRGFSCRSVR